MSSIFSDIENDIQNALAESYKITRGFFTTLFTDASALGRETGDLIFKHKLIPFSQAIQDAESQSVKETPIFSFLSNFGIENGRQLYNAESELVTNLIPIIGTFGHLADHPNEPLPAKISDIAFGLIDIPGVVELADMGRLLVTGADELSPLGKLAVRLGESKVFNYPLLALGIGSMLFPSSLKPKGDSIITKEYVYKSLPNLVTLKKAMDTTGSESYDPLALTLSPSSPSEPEITYILNNNELLHSFAKEIEENVDPSLRIERDDKERESEPKHTSNTFSTLYIGITLAIIAFIILVIMVKG
jgi:hypothetical protein